MKEVAAVPRRMADPGRGECKTFTKQLIRLVQNVLIFFV